jgi:hypothetical protein
MRKPTKIKKFNKAIKMLGVNNFAIYGLKRFYARFAMAHDYEGIKLRSMKARTVRGYSAMFEVMIAYSAFDSLLEGIEIFHKEMTDIKLNRLQHEIKNQEKLAETIRLKCNAILDIALQHCEKKLKNQIHKFRDGEHDNVFFVAAAIRHLTAHGLLSVNGGRLDLARNVEVFKKLSRLVLAHADEQFTKFSDQVYDYAAAQSGYDGL